MSLINFDLPRYALIINVAIAGLAAVGAALLSGGEVLLAVPALTVVFTLVLLARAGSDGAGEGGAALTVPLTGLATEEVAQETLSREFAAALRGRPLSVVLIRLEGLPKHRARHGKAATDELMRAVGRTLSRHRREMNLTAHYGGRDGTFLSILSGTDQEGARVYAARVRRDLLRLKGVPASGGVGTGIGSFDSDMETAQELVRKAAFALKQASPGGDQEPGPGARDRAGEVA